MNPRWDWPPRCLKASLKLTLDVNQKGTTVLLVEQNTQIALDIASRGYVMQTGEITLAGTTKSLKNNAMVKDLSGYRLNQTRGRGISITSPINSVLVKYH